MIVEIVTFPTPADWTRDEVLEDARHVVPKWASNKDLVRKHFAMGLGDDAGTSAGIYIWPSIEASKKAHDDAWREAVKKRSGSYPAIKYFDLFLLVDNENARVTEWSSDGVPREPVIA